MARGDFLEERPPHSTKDWQGGSRRRGKVCRARDGGTRARAAWPCSGCVEAPTFYQGRGLRSEGD